MPVEPLNRAPASRSSLGTLQLRKRLEMPRNQPSQYFSALDKSIFQKYAFKVCSQGNTCAENSGKEPPPDPYYPCQIIAASEPTTKTYLEVLFK